MLTLLLTIALSVAVYYYFRNNFSKWREDERLRLHRNSAFRNGHGEPALAPIPTRRRHMPARKADQPRLHARVKKQLTIAIIPAIAFLTFVGVVGQSLVPVALMVLPVMGIIYFWVRELERRERELDDELSGALASVGDRDGDWYIPENWL